MAPTIEIQPEPCPDPAQLAAWRKLWQRLIALPPPAPPAASDEMPRPVARAEADKAGRTG